MASATTTTTKHIRHCKICIWKTAGSRSLGCLQKLNRTISNGWKSTRESRFRAKCNTLLPLPLFSISTPFPMKHIARKSLLATRSHRAGGCRQRHSSSPWNRFTCVHVAHGHVEKQFLVLHTHTANTADTHTPKHHSEHKIYMNYTWILCMNKIANCAKRNGNATESEHTERSGGRKIAMKL